MKGSTILAFVVGAAAGSVVTWRLVKTKYEQIAQEEIDSVKETYANRVDDCEDPEISVDEQLDEDKETYRDIVENYKEGGSESMEIGTPPYVITYEEFNEIDDYETMCLNHYSDGIVADDWGEIIEDIDNVIGEDFASHFGDDPDEPDIVYVRNDRLKTDYEICSVSQKYSERLDSKSDE